MDGLADGLGDAGVLVDSSGLLVEGDGFLVADGFALADFDGLPAGREAGALGRRPMLSVRRCSASGTNRGGALVVGAGVGLGLGCGSGSSRSSSSSRPGSGNTALELTGPPARLTLTSPP
ncbi:hypothetical protein OHA21_35460 [Actinoplanes sp. NBC_00393]|uniref:hypothetical protein n=1 Tax=Actinoplanes sp. NBC_00393 TaxID=2975953 RepID=UPI002E1A08F5